MKSFFHLLSLSLIPLCFFGQTDARLIQNPDVSATHICFTFGNDLWIVDKSGGNASKLSSPPGRETNPRFSPDGQTIAFEANYDGNTDIYTLPVLGGVPVRVTGHGMYENIMDWTPDGRSILYSSSAESGKQRWVQFYTIPKAGGLPQKLPVELGAMASMSDDGQYLAFTDKSRTARTWKRYRGGTAPDIFLMNLATLETENITQNKANDEVPMWHGDKLYYMSDKGAALRNNIWVYDTGSKTHTQLTFFKDFDIHYPSIGPNDLVFEAGGKIYILQLSDHSYKEVKIHAIGDFSGLKPVMKTADNISSFQLAPDGNRALVEARGDIYTLPKKDGVVRNITQSSGVGERYPAWSPDGKSIAYFSDASGEYELTLFDIKSGKSKQVSKLGPGFRYNIFWAPNSKKLAFIDQTMTIYELNVESGETRKIDQETRLFEGGLRNFTVSYSSDSRWIAYTKSQENGHNAVYVYDSESGKSHKLTSGFYSDNQVSFDPEAKYLYLSTNREVSPVYSDFDNTWIYPNATQLALIPLRKDIDSPFAPKNDTVKTADDEEDDEEKEDTEKASDAENTEDDVSEVGIDLDGFERRLQLIPVTPGNMTAVRGAKGKVLYLKIPNSGSEGGEPELRYYDIEEQEEKTILSGVRSYELAHDGKHLVVQTSKGIAIIEAKADQKVEDYLPTSDMKSLVNPREEWKQIFNDVWRLERDFFYDANMHGVDWEALRIRYGALIEQAMSRYDVNYIIGELIGELNASHTYRGGGDNERADRTNVGYLGVDWSKENGEFRIKHIVQGAPWDNEVRSPLDRPGVDITVGDYILEVNGVRLNNYTDPWQAFAGLADATVELTVSSTASLKDSRQILVKTISDETRLRNLAWIESNRKMVEELSGGRIGYIYVPSTGIDGQNELARMFYGQWNKDALIVDERFNNGGQIPDRFVELLNRKPLAYFDVRDGANWQWPPVAHFGPKAMLINGWSGSGGDAFPDYFRKSGLGPLIGSRTWGGLIGISGAPSLIDGGVVTVPTFRMYDPDGTWFKEGHGVDPDIEVLEDHTALAKGKDPQIERAVNYLLKELDKRKAIHPNAPKPEDRSK